MPHNIRDVAAMHAALAKLYDALRTFSAETERWHKLHSYTNIPCDDYCPMLPAAQEALELARPLVEEGVHA